MYKVQLCGAEDLDEVLDAINEKDLQIAHVSSHRLALRR
jgi:hypothetical protein